MIKKIIISLLCISMINCNVVLAADKDAIGTTENLGIRSNAIIDKTESEKIEKYVQSIEENLETEIIDEYGKKTGLELEVTDVEVQKLNSNYERGLGVSTYAATAKVKTKSDSYKKYIIKANGVLTMKWSDGKKANNKITGLKGYWTIASGAFASGKIFWGSKYVTPTLAPHSKSVKSDFNVKINYKSEDSVAGKLRADSIAIIKAPKSSKKYQFCIKVSPTILD